jgi:hypothetical protein
MVLALLLMALSQSGCQVGEGHYPLATASAVETPSGGRGYLVECSAGDRKPCFTEAFRRCPGNYGIVSEYGAGNRFGLIVECRQ